jgi:(R,R)-butanediol dehydrogenase/meso-butanediol dehydrogenase/diacetyl reductase
VCIHALEEEIGCHPGIENAGGFAKYVRVAHPEYRLFRLPQELTFEEGTLIEPLACSLHAIRLSIFKPGDKVMVLGCGMIGLGVIAHLRNSGAGLIIATRGSNKKRGDMGLRLGADYVFNAEETPDLRKKVFELTDGHGIDVIFDCSGRPEAFLSAPAFLRPRGQIILVGNLTHEIPFVGLPFTLLEFSLQGSCCYYHDEFPMAMDFLKRRVSPITDVITSKIRLGEIVEKGFERIIKSDSGEIKIIVQPDE